jgi:peptidyl-prolyl cis-trans isomerase C
VHARHILIRVDPGATPDADAAAKTKAQTALDRVKGGEDFESVANEVTEDPTNAGKGGDLGFFPKERMVAPFSDAAFALQPGQVSDPVKTQFGYHVIKVEERRDAGILAFDDISAQLIQNLEQQATTNGIRSFLEREKAKTKIEREL